MKPDNRTELEGAPEPLTLLEELALKASSSIRFTKSRLGKVGHLLHRKQASPQEGRTGISPRPKRKEEAAIPDAAKAMKAMISKENSDSGKPTEPVNTNISPGQGPTVGTLPSALDDWQAEPYSTAILLNEAGQVLGAHASCTALLQWQPGELLGKELEDLLQNSKDVLRPEMLKLPEPDGEFENRTEEPIRVVARKKDGTEFPAQLRLKCSATFDYWTAIFSRVPGKAEKTTEAPNQGHNGAETKPAATPVAADNPEPAVAEPVAGAASNTPAAAAEPAGVAGGNGSERATLVGRILASETELHFLRRRLERETRDRKELEKRLEEVSASKAELEKRLGSQAAAKADPVESSASPESTTEPKPASEGNSPTEKGGEPAAAEPVAEKGTPSDEPQSAKPKGETAQGEHKADSGPRLEAIASCTESAGTDSKLREAIAALARVTTELEKERGDRRRSEQRAAALVAQLQVLHQEIGEQLQEEQFSESQNIELKQRLRETEESLNQGRAELQTERDGRRLAEQKLQVVEELGRKLEANLLALEKAKSSFRRREEEMQARLDAGIKGLKQKESSLHQERRERQRLQEALAKLERKLELQAENSRAEIAKLESGWHVQELERRHMDGQLLRSRYAAIQSMNECHGRFNTMREQMEPVVQGLHDSACRLLEIELPEDQKKTLGAVLEQVLLLQTNLKALKFSPEAPEVEPHPDTNEQVPKEAA